MKKYMVLMCMLVVANSSVRAIDPEVDKFIEEHKDSPQRLVDLLIDMTRWVTPDLEAAQKIFDLGVSVDAKNPGNIAQDNGGCTLLENAATYGHRDYVQLLLDRKANVEIKSPWDGRTALMAAALYHHEAIVGLLLQYKANPNATNCYLDSALTWACQGDNQSAKVVELLLAAQADVNHRNNDAQTPLCSIRETMRLSSDNSEIHKEIAAKLEQAGAKEYRHQALINSEGELVKIIDVCETYAIPREARDDRDHLKKGWQLIPVATTQKDGLAI